jgi:hypothetical protein
MSTKYTQIRYAMDGFEGGSFSPAGQRGDWLDVSISFEGDLPVKVPDFVGAPRVIVTPVTTTRFDPTFAGQRFNMMTPVCSRAAPLAPDRPSIRSDSRSQKNQH